MSIGQAHWKCTTIPELQRARAEKLNAGNWNVHTKKAGGAGRTSTQTFGHTPRKKVDSKVEKGNRKGLGFTGLQVPGNKRENFRGIQKALRSEEEPERPGPLRRGRDWLLKFNTRIW